MRRFKDQRFRKDYSNEDILNYLKGIYKILKRSPTSRDLNKFPGPAPTTVIRRFGSWSKGLKLAGIRPQTNQLMKGEKSIIRISWRKMTDRQIAKKLGVNFSVVRYYRMNFKLWKNRKGTAKSTFRKRALKLYGDKCEICNISLCEWHHLNPKSTNPYDWCILCPTCHAVITRKLVIVEKRPDLQNKLKPFIQKLYKNINF